MKEVRIKKYIKYLFGIAFLFFIFNKLLLRPWILANEFNKIWVIFTLSVPNFIEAILGTLVLTSILFTVRNNFFSNHISTIKDLYICTIALSLASVYVISQELKFHNLGGNNVYDPNDLIASLIGLLGTYLIILNFGFLDRKRI